MRVLWVIFNHYHRVLLEDDMNRREFALKATPDDDRRSQRCSLTKIAVGKPGTFIYMDSNLASADRPTMIAVRKPQLKNFTDVHWLRRHVISLCHCASMVR